MGPAARLRGDPLVGGWGELFFVIQIGQIAIACGSILAPLWLQWAPRQGKSSLSRFSLVRSLVSRREQGYSCRSS